MARQKGPIPPRRRGGPDPFGHRPGAPLNREASYAPPHTFGDPAANEQGIQKTRASPERSGNRTGFFGPFGDTPMGSSLGGSTIGGSPLPIAPEPVRPSANGQPNTEPAPMYRAREVLEPAAGAQVFVPRSAPVHETQDGQLHYVRPPSPDPASTTGQAVVVTRSESSPAMQVVLLQLHSLIVAFEEVERYDVHLRHNKRPPALWVDDAQYLQDVKGLLHELRRLNGMLEAAKAPDPAKVDETGGAIAYAAKRIPTARTIRSAKGWATSYWDLSGPFSTSSASAATLDK